MDDNTLCPFLLMAKDRVQIYSGACVWCFLLSGLELKNITHGTIHYQNTFGLGCLTTLILGSMSRTKSARVLLCLVKPRKPLVGRGLHTGY